MTDISLFERIKILFGLVFSSPFFLSLVVIFLLTTFVLVLYNRMKNKKLKYVVAVGYFAIAVLILIKYGPSILELSDSLVDQIFSFLYFPNIISYICMMIITTLLLIITLVNNNIKAFIKTCNIVTFVMIEILFVLSLDVITKNKIDIYTKTEIYSNATLMVLIQASTAIFGIWLLIIFINFLVDKINKKIELKSKETKLYNVILEENEKVPSSNLVLDSTEEVEEPKELSDEEFNSLFKKYNSKYNEIIKSNENNKK